MVGWRIMKLDRVTINLHTSVDVKYTDKELDDLAIEVSDSLFAIVAMLREKYPSLIVTSDL